MQGARPDFTLYSIRKGAVGADSFSILILLQLLNALLVVSRFVVGYRLVYLLVSFFGLIEYKQTKDKNDGELGRDQTIHEF